MDEDGWLRVRGVGRERVARYLGEFLTGAGYTVEDQQDGGSEASRSVIQATLTKANPAVVPFLVQIRLSVSPTAGGALITWESPRSAPPEAERPRAIRFLHEFLTHVERIIATESRGTAKVTRSTPHGLPFDETPRPPVPASPAAGEVPPSTG